MLNINTMSKILNGMDHPLSVDQMGGLDSCELVTKVMSDLRLYVTIHFALHWGPWFAGS